MEEHHQLTILPFTGLGHLIPLLELAKRLVNLHPSFRVTFLLFHDDALSGFLHTTTFPPSIIFTTLPLIDTTGFQPTDEFTLITLSFRASLPTIESILSQHPKPILLVDSLATEILQVAHKLSLPNYIFFSSTAQLLSFMLYLPVLDREVEEGEFVDLPGLIHIPGCTPIRPCDVVDLAANRKASFYTSFLYIAKRLHTVDGIVLNSCFDLESITIKALQDNPVFKQVKTPPVYPIGPIIKLGNSDAKHECITWLDEQPVDSVVYVSFGSQRFLFREQITELARELELSGQRFIWVVRKPEDADEGLDDPLAYLPEGFLERTSGIGRVAATWAPQVEILGHVATGGFFSHCGWNSTTESVLHGVPMMAWPMFAEQMMNATRMVDELGVAVRVEVMKREEIARVVTLVMEGQKGKRMRGSVRELKERVLRCLEEGGCSYNSLSQVIQEWTSKSAMMRMRSLNYRPALVHKHTLRKGTN